MLVWVGGDAHVKFQSIVSRQFTLPCCSEENLRFFEFFVKKSRFSWFNRESLERILVPSAWKKIIIASSLRFKNSKGKTGNKKQASLRIPRRSERRQKWSQQWWRLNEMSTKDSNADQRADQADDQRWVEGLRHSKQLLGWWQPPTWCQQVVDQVASKCHQVKSLVEMQFGPLIFLLMAQKSFQPVVVGSLLNLKLTVRRPKMKVVSQNESSLPTIHFQVLWLFPIFKPRGLIDDRWFCGFHSLNPLCPESFQPIAGKKREFASCWGERIRNETGRKPDSEWCQDDMQVELYFATKDISWTLADFWVYKSL